MIGKVKFFNEAKGFGFIISEEAQGDIFFHHSVIQGEKPKQDQTVEFETGEGRKGIEATTVSIAG